MTKWLIGHGVPPGLVGAARGALIGGAIAVVEALTSYFTSASLPGGAWLIAAPLIVAGLRSAEGALDGLKAPPTDPTKAQMAAQPAGTNNPAQ